MDDADEQCRQQLNDLAAYLLEREYISLLLTGRLTDGQPLPEPVEKKRKRG